MAGLTYRPLGRGEIRLLKLRSGVGLSFSLIHVTLVTAPEYIALSYTWGEPAFPKNINIDDQNKSVAENLHDALSAIVTTYNKKIFKAASTNLLWVDAVCINQDDIAERSSQVRLMKILYEKASKIYVWLGKPDNEANNCLAADLMKKIDDKYMANMKRNRPIRPWWWPKKRLAPSDQLIFLQDYTAADTKLFRDPINPEYAAWLGICALWNCAWWKRTWVYQEATVPESNRIFFASGVAVMRPKSKISFLSGSAILSWQEFQITGTLMGHFISLANPKIPMLDGVSDSFHRVETLRMQRGANQELQLLELLQIFRRSECKDPRDKVYAPLNLAPESATRTIIPDYNNPVQELYTDIVSYQMQQVGHELDFLGYTMRRDRSTTQHWPSWLPQWSDQFLVFPFPKVLHFKRKREGRSIRPFDNQRVVEPTLYLKKVYNATGDMQPICWLEGQLLHVQAVIFDTVDDVVDYHNADLSKSKCAQWSRDIDGEYWTGEDWKATLTSINAADVKYNLNVEVYERGGRIDPTLLDTAPDQLGIDEVQLRIGIRLSLQRATVARQLCRTQEKSLGLVPISTQSGDKICAFIGSQVLHVLRPVKHTTAEPAFEYIGESYIHGLMDGLIMDRVREGSATIEHIVLV